MSSDTDIKTESAFPGMPLWGVYLLLPWGKILVTYCWTEKEAVNRFWRFIGAA